MKNPSSEFRLFKFMFNNEEKSVLYTSKFFDNGRSIEDHIESRKNLMYIYNLYIIYISYITYTCKGILVTGGHIYYIYLAVNVRVVVR